MHPVHHVKDEVKLFDRRVWFGGSHYCSWSSQGGSFAHLQALNSLAYAIGFRHAVPDSSDEGFHARAMLAMLPQMPEHLNLSTFVGELKEVKGLFRRFTKKYWKQSKGELLADNRPDSALLEYEFGWRPFLSDTLKILVAMDIFEYELAGFLRRQGKWIVSHYGEEEEIPSFSTNHPVYSDANWNYSLTRSVECNERLRTATLYQRYWVPQPYDTSTKLWALLDALGLAKGLSTIYDLSPWTFMADWIVDVGGYISRNSSKMLQPTVEMGGYCFSKRYDFVEKVDYKLEAKNPYVFCGGGGTIMSRRYSFYERTPIAAPTWAADSITAGSGMKWVIGTALGTTRIRPRWRPKRKRRR